jgi:uncharacterized membrane protein
MSRLLQWTAYVLVLATALYFVLLAGVPYGVMSMIKSRLTAAGGGQANVMIHTERPSHTSRAVVRPSPELLYSICWYDLTKGPVRIVSGAPAGTYWSVAFYRDNTDNFHVVNDTQTQGTKAQIFLYMAAQLADGKAALDAKYPPAPGETGVESPSATGLVLIRTLINDDSKLPEIDAERRQATCAAVTP